MKGFAGGFGRRALGPWGEEIIKLFVREAVDEALKLETALSQLRTERRVVLLHYSPIAGTVEGEPQEIYPYLGSSRLEEPLIRYPVDAVFHGHAHHGTLEGRTVGGVPVYNVSLALLQRSFPDRPPFRVVELRGRSGRGAEDGQSERGRTDAADRTGGRQPQRPGRGRAGPTWSRRVAQPPAGIPFPPGTPSSVIARRSSTSSSSSAGSSFFFSTSCLTVSPVATASLASLAASA